MRSAVLAAAIGLVGCSLPDGEYFGDVPSLEGRDLTHLRWCNSGEPEGVDPAMATTTTASKLVVTLHDGLMHYDANGQPEPSLATSVDQSPDLRVFTFHLRRDARWSNGRPITAYDFAYHFTRILHPSTASPNGDALFPVKNAEAFLGNQIRVVLEDVPGLPAGSIVEVVGAAGAEEVAKAPDPNQRKASRALALRDLGAPASAAYATVPAGTTVRLIELSGRPASPPSPGAEPWAYVYWNSGDGFYGWVPAAELDQQPNGEVVYAVRQVSRRYQPGDHATPDELVADDPIVRPVVGDVRGKQLLMLPEALGLRVPDPYTFVIETKSPTPYVLNLVVQRAMRVTPREAVSRRPRRWAEPGSFVGSGGMMLDAWYERDRIEMVKNPRFWDAASIKLSRITAYSVGDQAAITNYYYTGGCDATTSNPAPTTYLPVMSGAKRNGVPYKDFSNVPWNGTYYPLVNAERLPNRHFRRALSYALDRVALVEIIKGGQTPSAQFSPGYRISTLSDEDLALCGITRDHPGVVMIMIPGQLCYVPPPGLDFDPEAAAREIAQARQEMGSSFPTTIAYRYNLGSEGHKLIAEFLQQAWQKYLGLSVKLEGQEWKTMVADATAGNYETMRFGAIGNFPDTEAEFLPSFKCTSPDNRSHWCNPAYDALVEAASRISDRKARLEKVYEAEQMIVEDASVIPLYSYTQQFLIRPYVRDLYINFTDQTQIERAWLDPDWRAHRHEASR